MPSWIEAQRSERAMKRAAEQGQEARERAELAKFWDSFFPASGAGG
jgi:hypothetical protein